MAKKIENVKLSAFPEEVDKDGLKWYGEYCSNVVLVLIHQTDYLLKRLLEKYKTEFLQDGGIKEQMSAARRQWRDEHGMGYLNGKNGNYENNGKTNGSQQLPTMAPPKK